MTPGHARRTAAAVTRPASPPPAMATSSVCTATNTNHPHRSLEQHHTFAHNRSCGDCVWKASCKHKTALGSTAHRTLTLCRQKSGSKSAYAFRSDLLSCPANIALDHCCLSCSCVSGCSPQHAALSPCSRLSNVVSSAVVCAAADQFAQVDSVDAEKAGPAASSPAALDAIITLTHWAHASQCPD